MFALVEAVGNLESSFGEAVADDRGRFDPDPGSGCVGGERKRQPDRGRGGRADATKKEKTYGTSCCLLPAAAGLCYFPQLCYLLR